MAPPTDMSQPRITKQLVERYANEGLTTRQMAEAFEREFGESRSPRSFAVAMSRYGVPSAHPRKRYAEELPWEVKAEHLMKTEARLLRAYGALRAGKQLSPTMAKRLASWIKKLDSLDAVVYYDGDTEQGFFLVPRRPQDEGYTRKLE